MINYDPDYDERGGTFESDPKINEAIRISLAGDREIPMDVAERVYDIFSSDHFTRGQPNDRTRREALSRARKEGWPVNPYSSLNTSELRILFDEVYSGVCSRLGVVV